MSRVTPEPNTGCWLWTGALAGFGYGIAGGNRYRIKAHREAYRLFVGDIPRDLCVLHKCDVPSCCNPAHLYLGTILDNREDMIRTGRVRLSVADVRRLRKQAAAGATAASLVTELGAAYSTVTAAIAQRSWRHISKE